MSREDPCLLPIINRAQGESGSTTVFVHYESCLEVDLALLLLFLTQTYSALCLLLLHSLLLSGVHQMYVASSMDERDRFVSSIIKTLEADEVLRLSMANCRAYVFRAELYGQAGRLDEAIADAERAIQLLRSASSSPSSSSSKSAPLLLAKAYRVLADTYEQTGNCELAMKALQGAAAADPASRTKLSKEMQRLQQRVAESS